MNEEFESDFRLLIDVLAAEAPEEIAAYPAPTVKNFRRLLLIARDVAPDNLKTFELLVKYADGDPLPSEIVTGDTREFICASRRVCRVEPPDGTPATGFLVGPDLVLTAAHVLFGVDGFPLPGQVLFRFDLFVWKGDREADQVVVKARSDIGNAWVVAFSHPSLGSQPPTALELDYALLRIADPIGAKVLPHHGRRHRGWMDGSAAEIPPVEKHEISILQHPNGRALRFSRGPVLRLQPANRRVFYQSDTNVGASGAPVLNESKQIVGMHTFSRDGAPNNEKEGVNFQAIFADLQSKNIVLERYPPRRV